MSLYLHKSHNVSCIIYHIVCPTKYRRVVMSEQVDQTIKETCLEIAKRYDMHFLIQSVPMMLPKNVVQTVKSIVGRAVFEKNPEVKQRLLGGKFWTSGYFINTVSRHGSESAIANYVRISEVIERAFRNLPNTHFGMIRTLISEVPNTYFGENRTPSG